MCKALFSERFLFLIPEDFFSAKRPDSENLTLFERGNQETITEAIHRTGLSVLNICRSGQIVFRMIPSLTMMQQFLYVHAPKHAVEIFLTMGGSSAEEIAQDGLEDRRTLFLPFPGVEYPKEADGFISRHPLDFIYHDFFHSIIASEVPPSYRTAFIHYAEIIWGIKKRYEKKSLEAEYLQELYERMIDMEHPAFRRRIVLEEGTATDGQTFLLSCILQEEAAISRMGQKLFKSMSEHDPNLSEDDCDALQHRLKIQVKSAVQHNQIIMHLAKEILRLHTLDECGFTKEDIRIVYAHKARKNCKKKKWHQNFLDDLRLRAEDCEDEIRDVEEELTLLQNWSEHNLCEQLLRQLERPS